MARWRQAATRADAPSLSRPRPRRARRGDGSLESVPRRGRSRRRLARTSAGALPALPRRGGLPSGQDPASAKKPRPTAATFRANPSPEVTDPVCRLPLPTLLYRPEAAHLGDLLRKFGTDRRDALRRPRSAFQGPSPPARPPGADGHAGGSSPRRPYRAATAFQGFRGSGRKDNSSWRRRRRRRVSLGRPVGLLPGPRATEPDPPSLSRGRSATDRPRGGGRVASEPGSGGGGRPDGANGVGFGRPLKFEPATGCRNLHRLPFRPTRRGFFSSNDSEGPSFVCFFLSPSAGKNYQRA